MDSNLIEKISVSDFNAEKYVRELSQKWVGCNELRQQRKAVQALAESTNVSLKKNVYENYTQFIDTAKEIAHLESEMYQLSHLLSEQKSLLDAIYNSNIHSDLDPTVLADKNNDADCKEDEETSEDESRRRKLTAIMEKVEGCSGLLDVKDRTVLHEGDLTECDPVENNPLYKIHAYLFNDTLMLTQFMKDRRGPVKYKMYKTYDISSLAVVNVRGEDVAFKIIAYPDTILFNCKSGKAKMEWLERFDIAKKQKLASEKLKREVLNSQSSVDSIGKVKTPLDKEVSLSQSSIESPTAHWEDSYQRSLLQPQLPDWFIESPDDLEVFIAERHFEDALDLLIKAKEFCKTFNSPDDSCFIEIREKNEGQKKNLTDTLVKELEVSPDKSLQGGLRAARRAVRLLNALGRQTQACELLLELCTSIMKKELKNVKREGSSMLYVQRLGHQFYSTMLEVASEFTREFESAQTCIAALVVWTNTQLAQFVNHVIKQVFVPQVSLSTIADCVATLRTQNEQLSDCGMDFRYEMAGILQKPITVVVRDAKEKALDALKHRANDDKWHPYNLFNKNNMTKLLEELDNLGVHIPQSFIRGDCWLELTANTISFLRMEMALLEDCCKLYSQHLHHIIEETLYEVFRCQLKLMDTAVHSNNPDIQVEVIQKNALFLMDHLLKHIESVFEANMRVSSTKLASLAHEYIHLKSPGAKPKPAPRQQQQQQAAVPKYSSEEFI